MTIAEFQAWVQHDWENNSPKMPDAHLQLLYVIEEFGEVAEAIRKNQGDKKRKDVNVDLEGEMGDFMITIATLANSHGISLEKAIQKAQTKIIARHERGH